ncbi:hypothetical protein [Algihabitans albus]|nr:hypothetical protein [Algihabitans albus]
MEILFIVLLIATLVAGIPAALKSAVWPKVAFVVICAVTFKLGMLQFYT